LKIVTVVLGFAVAVSVMTETDLLKLLGGIGAFAAVLIFIFKDTATDAVEKLIVI
jgi:small-conductance mechanosensitive channel